METHSIRELLISLIEEECDRKGVTLDSAFTDLDMDSLDFTLLLQEIRQKIGPITDEQATRCNTVGDLLKVLS